MILLFVLVFRVFASSYKGLWSFDRENQVPLISPPPIPSSSLYSTNLFPFVLYSMATEGGRLCAIVVTFHHSHSPAALLCQKKANTISSFGSPQPSEAVLLALS